VSQSSADVNTRALRSEICNEDKENFIVSQNRFELPRDFIAATEIAHGDNRATPGHDPQIRAFNHAWIIKLLI